MVDTWPVRQPSDLADIMGISFSDEQLAAITAPLAPSLIVAGAGTGKTTVMAARVVWLVGSGQVPPDGVLGLTFTRRAAAELAQRIAAALTALGLAVDDEGPTVATYDSFVGQLLARHGHWLGAGLKGRLMAGAEPYQLAVEAVNEPGFQPQRLGRWRLDDIAARLVRLDGQMAAHMVPADQLLAATKQFVEACGATSGVDGAPSAIVRQAGEVARDRLELLAFVQRYRQLKLAAGCAQFADQQAAATGLAAQLGTALRSQFPLVLLDEYQDTSAAQAAMLSGLFSGPDADFGRGHAVSAVGDPLQSIYGWRGAAADNMGQFAWLFPQADGTAPASFPLRINRRSGANIVAAANAVAAQTGTVEQPLAADPLKAPGVIEAMSFQTWPEETAAVAARVVEAQRLGQAERWSDVGVLARRNADVPALYEALTRAGVPVEIVGLGGLLALPEVAAVVAVLSLAHDDLDNPAVALLVSGPSCGLGTADMEALARRARQLAAPAGATQSPTGHLSPPAVAEGRFELAPPQSPAGRNRPPGPCGEEVSVRSGPAGATQSSTGHLSPPAVAEPSLADAVFDPGDGLSEDGRRRLAKLAHCLRAVRSERHGSCVDLVRIAADELGLTAELAVPSEWAQACAPQVQRFFAQVGEHAASVGSLSLAGLLSWLKAESAHGDELEQATPSDQDSVKLLTVHKAKGLEWSVVMLPCLAEGVFPSDKVTGNPVRNAAALPYEWRLDAASLPPSPPVTAAGFNRFAEQLKDEQVASEDRLSYVATSRAKSYLVASTSSWRATWVKPRPPSRLFNLLARQAAADGHAALVEPAACNPLAGQSTCQPWPPALPAESQASLDELAAAVLAGTPGEPVPLASLEDAEQVAAWRGAIAALVEPADGAALTLPQSLSASALMAARRDPRAFLEAIRRPMPRVADELADRGTLFHRWVERRFKAVSTFDELDDDDDATAVVMPDETLSIVDLVQAFEAGRFAWLTPLAVEQSFVAVIAGQQVRGRIDAIYESGPGRYQIVDWKTSAHQGADPVQLAIYKLAWAQVVGCPPDQVDAVFYYVMQDKVVRPALVAPAEIEGWVMRLRRAARKDQSCG